MIINPFNPAGFPFYKYLVSLEMMLSVNNFLSSVEMWNRKSKVKWKWEAFTMTNKQR